MVPGPLIKEEVEKKEARERIAREKEEGERRMREEERRRVRGDGCGL